MRGDAGQGSAKRVVAVQDDGGFAQCPGCYTLFRVSGEQLRAAAGTARCGLCGEFFDAAARLHRDLPNDLPTGEPVPATPPPGRAAPRSRPRRPMGASRRMPTGLEADGAGADWRLATALEVEDEHSPRRRRRWPWVVALGLLAVLAAGQALWQQRDALAANPAWRPWVAEACAVLGCELRPVRRPDAVEVAARTLREHPQLDDTLLFTATLINRADEAQPWPQLGLILTALNGERVAAHWFDAGSYLAAPEDAAEFMPPDAAIAVRIGFPESEPRAESFEIRFR